MPGWSPFVAHEPSKRPSSIVDTSKANLPTAAAQAGPSSGSPPSKFNLEGAGGSRSASPSPEVERLPEGRNTFLEASYVEKIAPWSDEVARGRASRRISELARNGFMTSALIKRRSSAPPGAAGPEATDHRRNLPAQAALGKSGKRITDTADLVPTDDAMQTILANVWRTRRLLPPNEESRWRRRWDYLLVTIVLYNCFTIPLELAFAAESHPAVDWGIDAFFWIDLALNFRTTYFDEDGELVTDVWAITRRYLRGWFALDLSATLPFEALSPGASWTGALKLPRLFRLSKLMKKLETMRAANALRVIKARRRRSPLPRSPAARPNRASHATLLVPRAAADRLRPPRSLDRVRVVADRIVGGRGAPRARHAVALPRRELPPALRR